MFDAQIQKTRGSLLLNKNEELAFIYGTPLPFSPQWASIDAALGEIFIGAPENSEHEGQGFKLGKIEKNVYDKIMTEKKILLVAVEGGDIRFAQDAALVPLMIVLQKKTPDKTR